MKLTDDQYTELADRVGRAAANELAPLIEGWLEDYGSQVMSDVMDARRLNVQTPPEGWEQDVTCERGRDYQGGPEYARRVITWTEPWRKAEETP